MEKINLHNCFDLIAIYNSIFHLFQKWDMEKIEQFEIGYEYLSN